MSQRKQKTGYAKKHYRVLFALLFCFVFLSANACQMIDPDSVDIEPSVFLSSGLKPTPEPIPTPTPTPPPEQTPDPTPEPDPIPDIPQVTILPLEQRKIDPSLPMIALTFDDGPSKLTNQFLDVLEEYGAVATFYVIGEYVRNNSDTIQRAHEMGCEIANHTWSHRRLTRISNDAIRSQLKDTSDAIENAIGVRPTHMRPPWGESNANVLSVSRELGLSVVFWSVDTSDYLSITPERIYNKIIDEARDKDIVLMHDTYERTLDALKMLLPSLVEKGYQFVTVSELMEFSDKELEPGKSYNHGR